MKFLTFPYIFDHVITSQMMEKQQPMVPQQSESKLPDDVHKGNKNQRKWINPEQLEIQKRTYQERMDEAKEDLETQFTEHYGTNGEAIGDGIKRAFLEVIDKAGFKGDFERIRRDVCFCGQIERSVILKYIWDNIQDLFANIANGREHQVFIADKLQDIIAFRGRRFAIKHISFGLKQRHVNEARPLPHSECPSLYIHPEGDKNTKSGRARLAEDKSLMIAKAVDIKNGYPLLLWLMDSFSRKRAEEHGKLWVERNVADSFQYPFDEDEFARSDGKGVPKFNAATWFMYHSLFCKYIQRKCEKLALPMMTAIHALSKRAVPSMNYDCRRFPTMIHDDYCHFVEYTKASWELVYHLSKSSVVPLMS